MFYGADPIERGHHVRRAQMHRRQHDPPVPGRASASVRDLLYLLAYDVLIAARLLWSRRRFGHARLSTVFPTLILIAFQIVLLGQVASPLIDCGPAGPSPLDARCDSALFGS